MPPRDDGPLNNTHIAHRPRDLTAVSRTVLRSEQAKKWTKRYRTELAASSSSLLSTFFAYPLDSVKTRLQACAVPPKIPVGPADVCQLPVQLV
jgi:solute carrier family 25 carnitine/acylcarnitine transporter 20/29